MKTRDAGFPAFFVPPSRPRGADEAQRRDATEGQEGGTGKMRFKRGLEARSGEQIFDLRTSEGLKPEAESKSTDLRTPLPGEPDRICLSGILWMYFGFVYGIRADA